MIISIRSVPPAAEKRLSCGIRSEKGTLREVVCPVWDHGAWRDSLAEMKKLYADIFAEAVRRNVSTLILPILGEENDRVPVHRSAEALLDAACRSYFAGKCIVEAVRYPEPTIRVPHVTLIDAFRTTYLERPEHDVFMRVAGDGIAASDHLSVIEEGTGKDTTLKSSTAADGVFTDPVKTWQAAKQTSPDLAKNLYAVMHELYFAPQAFVMNTAGSLPDGTEIVIFRLLESASAEGSGIPFGYYEKNTLLICRISGGRGYIRMTIPEISKTVNISFFTEEALRDTFEGCILGGAAGDALGYPVEFMSDEAIRAEYGGCGIREFELTAGNALISDDTQMTLFTMDGLRQGILRAEYKGIGAIPETYAAWAYQDWYHTQLRDDHKHYSGFTDLYRGEKWLAARRAPGNTCLSALEEAEAGSVNPPYSNRIFSTDDPANNSKGCGGVMRVAPVGLMLSTNHRIDKEGAAHTAAEAAAVTHGHPLGWLPAAFLAELIHRITYRMDGSVSLRDMIKNTLAQIDRQFAGTPYLEEFDAIVRKAVRMAEDENLAVAHNTRVISGEEEQSRRDAANIHAIGGGWVGEEALAIALYCVLRYPDDFQKALCIAVNHSGDSDSTGAIAGNILGAHLGLREMQFRSGLTSAHPLRLEKLEMADRLLYWTDAAFSVIMLTRKKVLALPGKEKDPEYCYMGMMPPVIADHRSSTAYSWNRESGQWVERPGLYAELEWGSATYHKMKLMDGFEPTSRQKRSIWTTSSAGTSNNASTI